MADNESVLQDLQSEIQRAKSSNQILSSLARQGTDKLIQEFFTENVKIQSSGPHANLSHLYLASFWGVKSSVKQLLEAGTNPNVQNERTLWTPLHAAAFQEHGPVIMLLLEYGAQPELPDAEHRTAADFASVSDKIWPFFAALDVRRTSRTELIEKGILRPGSGTKVEREPGFGIDMAGYKSSSDQDVLSNNYLAAMSGDVLAEEKGNPSPGDLRHGTQPQFSLWK